MYANSMDDYVHVTYIRSIHMFYLYTTNYISYIIENCGHHILETHIYFMSLHIFHVYIILYTLYYNIQTHAHMIYMNLHVFTVRLSNLDNPSFSSLCLVALRKNNTVFWV